MGKHAAAKFEEATRNKQRQVKFPILDSLKNSNPIPHISHSPMPNPVDPLTAGASTSSAHHHNPTTPLQNLAAVQSKIDAVRDLLSESVTAKTILENHQLTSAANEISSAIHQIIVNGAALIALTQSEQDDKGEIVRSLTLTEKTAAASAAERLFSDKLERSCKTEIGLDISEDWETIELGSEELLAEHVHFCEICGKGFKRDANLRMHMRAHGDEFKTPEALTKPEKTVDLGRKMTRFSCPFVGCNRNKLHKKFKALRSVICVKNHFKRSHCPKMYACSRCNKKSFAVMGDLKSHLKHCGGESKWRCSCGTSFSRKDKLFGHMTLFEGHMPAVAVEEEEKGKEVVVDDEEEDLDDGSLDGLIQGFGKIEDFCFEDMLKSPNSGGFGGDIDGFFDF